MKIKLSETSFGDNAKKPSQLKEKIIQFEKSVEAEESEVIEEILTQREEKIAEKSIERPKRKPKPQRKSSPKPKNNIEDLSKILYAAGVEAEQTQHDVEDSPQIEENSEETLEQTFQEDVVETVVNLDQVVDHEESMGIFAQENNIITYRIDGLFTDETMSTYNKAKVLNNEPPVIIFGTAYNESVEIDLTPELVNHLCKDLGAVNKAYANFLKVDEPMRIEQLKSVFSSPKAFFDFIKGSSVRAVTTGVLIVLTLALIASNIGG